MRIFGSDRISGLMLKLGMEEGVPIEHGLVSKSIERAQKQVEAQNFAVRKHLLEYDDVMNKQRTAVYDLRRMVLEGKSTREHILSLDGRDPRVVPRQLHRGREPRGLEPRGPAPGPQGDLRPRRAPARPQGHGPERDEGAAGQAPSTPATRPRSSAIGAEQMLLYERMIMLQIVDTQWKDHLYSLDHLKEGIGLRGYGQRDPLVEYKKESFKMFQALMDRIDEESLRWVYLYQPVPASEAPRSEAEPWTGRVGSPGPCAPPGALGRGGRRPLPRARARHGGARALPRNLSFNDPSEAQSAFAKAERPEAKGGQGEVQTVRRDGKKVGRNDPCPCGSGKKYKKCHGGG